MRRRWWWGSPANVMIVAVLAIGVLVRTVGYFHRASLWGDEAMIALNVGARSLGELTMPLDYAQVAPVPFLWAERLAVMAGGMNEYALRLLPFASGVLLLLAIGLLARRLLERTEALVAIALAATAFPLIRYAAEVKPYALDALLSTGLTALALGVLRRPDDATGWRRLAAAGIAAILASIPAVFVGTGIAAALLADSVRRRASPARALGTGTLWLVAALVTFLLWYRQSAGGEYMHRYWAATLLVPGTAGWWPRFDWGSRSRCARSTAGEGCST